MLRFHFHSQVRYFFEMMHFLSTIITSIIADIDLFIGAVTPSQIVFASLFFAIHALR